MSEKMISIDMEAELRKIVTQLNSLPDMIKAPDVLARALNKTAFEAKRKLGKEVQKEYALTDTAALTQKKRGGMYLEKATGGDPAAVLHAKGPMLNALAYTTQPNSGPVAAMMKVLSESHMTAVEVDGRKAFLTKFLSGHVALAQRKGPERLPIKTLQAPAVPMLYGKVYEAVEPDVYSILQKHIQRQVSQVLGRT